MNNKVRLQFQMQILKKIKNSLPQMTLAGSYKKESSKYIISFK